MPVKPTIRPEQAADIDAISSITEQAFRDHPVSQHTEQYVVAALRQSGALSVSLVAEVDGQVVGHIAFSPVQISSGCTDWYALGPVSVTPSLQRQGIGSALIKAGLDAVLRLGAKGCVLVGEPDYYERFGFESHANLSMEGIPQQYVLSLPFKDQPRPTGTISHHEAFHAQGPET